LQSLSQHDKNGTRVISAKSCCRQRQLWVAAADMPPPHPMAAFGATSPPARGPAKVSYPPIADRLPLLEAHAFGAVMVSRSADISARFVSGFPLDTRDSRGSLQGDFAAMTVLADDADLKSP
jgi:hypothetical protein